MSVNCAVACKHRKHATHNLSNTSFISTIFLVNKKKNWRWIRTTEILIYFFSSPPCAASHHTKNRSCLLENRRRISRRIMIISLRLLVQPL